ncbi:DUF1365 domain-containing protein [Magnetospirillum gryphiswaldense]|nr:DUF1365 domain-containing protein [Magnetospirillum gryphiswaldense]
MGVSCLYRGQVMHHRLDPVGHRFAYSVVSLLVDLDELPHLGLRLLSHNRANLFSLHDRDLGDGGDPKAWIARQLAAHGLKADGPIRVHLFPRVLGMGFTPLTTWFCHHSDGALAAVVYEVHNTFGERHAYLVPVQPSDSGRTLTHRAEKCFHVSPFMDLGGTYRFALKPPGDTYAQTIRETAAGDDHTIMVASHMGRRQELTDSALFRAALAYPLLPVKIVGGIHFEALRLWLKGVPFFRKPAPPVASVSICQQGDA